jgi:hypothetical protein
MACSSQAGRDGKGHMEGKGHVWSLLCPLGNPAAIGSPLGGFGRVALHKVILWK